MCYVMRPELLRILYDTNTIHSLNYTSAPFLEHHAVDIVLCYGRPHISSIGSIDNRNSALVTKMASPLGESRDLQFIVQNLHVTSRRTTLKIKLMLTGSNKNNIK